MVQSRISDEAPPSFRQLLGVRSFAVLFTAEIQSLVGDQVARVALAALVFERTGSVAATAVTYALTYLPGVLGGLVLARVGDRLPRGPVLVGADLVRTVAFASMALPGVPIGPMLVLLAVAVFVEPAFSAAQFAYLAAALTSNQMRTATGLRMAATQAAQVAGFALGGLLVAALGARRVLIVDALTFAVSALIITLGLRIVDGARTAPDRAQRRRPGIVPGEATSSAGRTPAGTLRWIRDDHGVRRRVGLICLAGVVVVPEGLAIPYADHVHGSTAVAGILLASMPMGAAVGALALARFVAPRRRARTAAAMAVACGLPLVISAVSPSWPIAFAAWTLSGALAAYQVEVIGQLADLVPDPRRSSVMGVVGGGLIAAQGLAIGAFGLAGQWLGPGPAIAMAGLLTCTIAIVLFSSPAHRFQNDLAAVGHRS